MKVASFFSGIGGLDLGFETAGFDVVFQCEVKTFCQKILRQHWPCVKLKSDIRSLDEAEIPDAPVWLAGFPCQDLSLARMGPRRGLRGSQSGLFHDFIGLVGERLPRAIVLENVHGLLSSHGGRDFTVVLKALDELGYGVAWRVLNSKDFGVPQQRRRVYIVAVHRDVRSAGQILFEPECGNWHPSAGGSHGKKSPSVFQTILGDPIKGPLYKSVAHCIYAESARHTGTDWSRNYVWYPDGRVRRLTPNEVELAQGFPRNWTRPGDDYGDGDSTDSLRYHAVGNAVSPPVALWVAQRMMSVLSRIDQSALEPDDMAHNSIMIPAA